MAVGKIAPASGIIVVYAVCLGLAAGIWHFVTNGELPAILTMSEIFQCFAFVTLAMQVLWKGSIAGISARSLSLEAAALCLRLSSTLWLDGYLPIDPSGDWVIQTVNICSVLVVIWLLREVLVTRRSSYQADKDSAPYISILVIVCIALGVFLHGDMNGFPLFDALWMTGLFLGVVAVLPQLYLIAHTGGKLASHTGHYIAMMAVSRVCGGCFMWIGRGNISCNQWVLGFNHAIWAILSAHLLHLFLLGDFAFIYMRTMVTQCAAAISPSSTVYLHEAVR